MSGIKDLAKSYAQKHGVTIAEAEVIMKNALGVVSDAIVKDGGISFIGNFTIESVQRKERMGRNPATGETHTIPATVGLRVRCGKLLKERLNP